MISALMVLWLWLTSLAWGYDVTFCVDVNVDFAFSSSGGDFWTNNTVNKAARGFDFTLVSVSPAAFRQGNFSEDDGDAGCVDLTGLPGGTAYTLTVSPSAEVFDMTLVHDDASDVAFANITISSSGTKNYTISYSDEAYQQLAAVAYAVHSHDLGAAGTITLQFCSGATCSETNGAGDTIDLYNDADKYLIAHEVGHALMWQQTSMANAVCSCSSGCNGGDNFNRKWWAQAFREGIAWWYSVITWNAPGNTCDWLNTQNLDVDLDNDPTPDYTFGQHLPCWGDPDNSGSGPDYTDGEDWLDDLYTNNSGTCTGSPTNHTTEYDVVHYGWGLYAFGSDGVSGDANDLTADQVMALILAADPANWDPDEDTGTIWDDPWQALNLAAVSFGLLSEVYLAHQQQKGAVNH